LFKRQHKLSRALDSKISELFLCV